MPRIDRPPTLPTQLGFATPAPHAAPAVPPAALQPVSPLPPLPLPATPKPVPAPARTQRSATKPRKGQERPWTTPVIFSLLRIVCIVAMIVSALLGLVSIAVARADAASWSNAAVTSQHLHELDRLLARANSQLGVALIDPPQGDDEFAAFSTTMGDAYRTMLGAAVNGPNRLDAMTDLTTALLDFQDQADTMWAVASTNPLQARRDYVALQAGAFQTAENDLLALLGALRLNDPPTAPSPLTLVAATASGCTVILLIGSMVVMARRTHRVLNLWLLGSVVATVVTTVALAGLAYSMWDAARVLSERNAEAWDNSSLITQVWDVRTNLALAVIDPQDSTHLMAANGIPSITRAGFLSPEDVALLKATVAGVTALVATPNQAAAALIADHPLDATGQATSQDSLWAGIADRGDPRTVVTVPDSLIGVDSDALTRGIVVTLCCAAGVTFAGLGFRARLKEFQ